MTPTDDTTAPVHSRWLVVDVETSGENPDEHRVLSVAALAVDDDAAVTASLVSLVDAGVDPGPTHIHGLTAATLAGAPRFHDIAAEMAGLCRGRVLVAHNAAFDYAFLAAEAARAGVPLGIDAVMCTVELGRTLNLGLPDLKLATLARHWGVSQTRPHDALDDAQVAAHVLARELAVARDQGVALPIRYPATLTRPVFTGPRHHASASEGPDMNTVIGPDHEVDMTLRHQTTTEGAL